LIRRAIKIEENPLLNKTFAVDEELWDLYEELQELNDKLQSKRIEKMMSKIQNIRHKLDDLYEYAKEKIK